MLRKLMPRSIYDVMAAMACFGVLAGGTAYAANTVFSTDIVDGEVKAPDIAANAVDSARVRDNTLNTFDVHSFLGADVVDGSLTGADISDNTIGVNDIGSQQVASDEVLNDSLLQSDIRAGAVTGDEVLDNSLGGADINESSLNLPQTPTSVTFAGTGAVVVGNNTMAKIVGKTLPAGSWAVVATATLRASAGGAGPFNRTAVCELRNGTGFIGGTSDRRVIPASDSVERSLSMNGGAQVPAGGGEVSLWCQGQGLDSLQFHEAVIGSQMMMIRLDGFS